jgi:hypothetical protein
MIDIQQNTSVDTTLNIRITGINRNKTRMTDGLDARYQVYFELSGMPAQAWTTIFRQEWKALNLAQPLLWSEANIDNKFLVMHCFLQEIASTYLPVLKKAVAATNSAYSHYVHNEATEHDRRNEVWKQERKAVDVIAESLRFE